MKKKILVLDTETTGLDPKADELLQISMIDGEGATVLNTYCKPETKTEWTRAMEVNGITPERVANELSPKAYTTTIQRHINEADVIVHYNGQFDIKFLNAIGVEIPEDKKQFDVMKAFAPIYGEKFKNGNYKNKKLVDAAQYFKFNFDAHDSLEDCRATLFCYQKITNPIRKIFRKPLKLVGIKIQ